jgi:hypothetical protein
MIAHKTVEGTFGRKQAKAALSAAIDAMSQGMIFPRRASQGNCSAARRPDTARAETCYPRSAIDAKEAPCGRHLPGFTFSVGRPDG